MGDGGTILTSSQGGTNGIISRFRDAHGFSLRLTTSQLIADLPETMLGPGAHAAIYTVVGNKVVELNATHSGGEISVPINQLGNGGYVFEVSKAGRRIAKAFRISR